jgi:hypothetical protein
MKASSLRSHLFCLAARTAVNQSDSIDCEITSLIGFSQQLVPPLTAWQHEKVACREKSTASAFHGEVCEDVDER